MLCTRLTSLYLCWGPARGSCAHKQKVCACIMRWVGTIDRCGYMANKKGRSWIMSLDLKYTDSEASFWPNLTDSLRLVYVYESLRCLGLKIRQFLCSRQQWLWFGKIFYLSCVILLFIKVPSDFKINITVFLLKILAWILIELPWIFRG